MHAVGATLCRHFILSFTIVQLWTQGNYRGYIRSVLEHTAVFNVDDWKNFQGRVSYARHLQWLTETLQFLLMVYSRFYISLHISQMFCVGCGKLPGLIQCSPCHRRQGAGPLLCMTDWNEAAEPRCGQNTTLNTALPQLHTPDSTDSFPIHISPADPMQHKAWHAASIGVQWERGSERRGCQEPTPTLSCSFLSRD